MLYPVILSGGTGTRLWPQSRSTLPKQFLALTTEKSLLQETVLRLQGVAEMGAPLVVSNEDHRFMVAEQLRELGITPKGIFLEPVGRNTAPAIAAAALHLAKDNADALMLVLPSDHVIENVPAFHAALAEGIKSARAGHLVTFGIVPWKAETGYGYIQCGAPLGGEDAPQPRTHEIVRFVEKPDLATAQSYLDAGDYYWNSGMFLFSAAAYLAELERLQPQIVAACREALEKGQSDLDFYRLDEQAFRACPALSIDHAVMEHTSQAVVIPIDVGWNDIGSWGALWENQPKDENGNVVRGEAFLHDSRNCYVWTEKSLVATVGVEDLVIVETGDAVLIARKDKAQDVKAVVDWLKASGRTEHVLHRRVYRPWGSYEGMDRGERFQVKRLIVKPGEQSSLQMHHHRSEHWIVVSGTAAVTLGDEVRLVSENESIYIPLGITHRIHNPGRIPLHFIEVQSGPYLGEDDIVRTDDNYGRAPQ